MTTAVANGVSETAGAALPADCGSGQDGARRPGLSLPSDVHLGLEIFLDLRNVDHSAHRLGCPRPDYGRLVRGAAQEFARRLGMTLIEDAPQKARECRRRDGTDLHLICRRTWVFVGKPENVHPADRKRVQGWKRWVAGLKQRYGFEVLSTPVDFHGFHMRAEDRANSSSESERQWQPVEKGLDVLLAIRTLRRATAPDRPDAILIISGDGDFAPVLRQIQELEPPIHVAVAGFSHALSRVFYKRNPVGYVWGSEPILLDPYLAPLARTERNAPASGRTGSVGDGARTVEGATMSSTNGDRDGARKASQHGAAPKNRSADPDIGRIVAACPKRGELQVYRKVDGLMGAKVFCEDDGRRYGVSPGVMKRFPNVGTYRGLAYVDEGRDLAFKFVAGGASAAREAILTISAAFGRVHVPGSLARGKSLEHGKLVAFHWRLENGNGDGKARRRAESLFPLDADHLPLIARLIAKGKLAFPAHAGALDAFLGGLASGDVPPQDAEAVQAALNRLADDPKIPSNVRMVVRVERARLGPGGPQTPAAPAPKAPPAGTPNTKVRAKPGRAGRAAGSDPLAGDVLPLDLQVD